MQSLKTVLMSRDGLTSQEADKAIEECRNEMLERIEKGDLDADDVLMEHFGLEPDYVIDLLDY